jgi:hypothetical protein
LVRFECELRHAFRDSVPWIDFYEGKIYALQLRYVNDGVFFELLQWQNSQEAVLYSQKLSHRPANAGSLSVFDNHIYFGLLSTEIVRDPRNDREAFDPMGSSGSAYDFVNFSIVDRKFTRLNASISFPNVRHTVNFSMVSAVSFSKNRFFLSRSARQIGFIECSALIECVQYQLRSLELVPGQKERQNQISRIFENNTRRVFAVASDYRFALISFDGSERRLSVLDQVDARSNLTRQSVNVR